MYPILLSFGQFTVHTYGFCIAVGFILSVLYISNRLQKTKQKLMTVDKFYSFVFYLLFAAIIGARILYVIINFNEYQNNLLDIFKVWQGGLVYYGGFILALIVFFTYTYKNKIKILKFGDLFVPAVALGHCFGRIGCFFAGCCYGKISNIFWSVIFNNPNSLAPTGIHLHPTQLYEAFANLFLFVFLHLYNRKKHQDGNTIVLYLVFYAVIRFVIEFFRGDFRGDYILGLSVSQFISIFIFTFAIILFFTVNSNARKNKIR